MLEKIYTYLLKYKWTYAFTVFVLSYFFIPLLIINGTAIFNIDEYCFAFDVLNRLCGVPLECSAWPGGTVQFLSFPVLMVHTVMNASANGFSLNSFVTSYADAYFNVNTSIAIIRIINLMFFLGLLIVSFHIVIKETKNVAHKIICLLIFSLFITNSEVTVIHWTATADSMAVSFSFFGLIVLLFSKWKYKASIAGAALGLAIACKITYLFNTPLFFVILLLENKPRKGFLSFTFFALLSFFIVCPFIWTDSLRLLKSLFGNFSRTGNPVGMKVAFDAFLEVVSLPLILLFLFLCFFQRKKETLVVGLTALFLALFNVFVASRSGVFYLRYYLPISLSLVTVILYLIPSQLLNRKTYTVLLIAVLLIVTGIQSVHEIRETYSFVSQQQEEKRGINRLTDQLIILKQDKKILVPYELMYEITPICSQETFGELLDDLEKTNSYLFFKQAGLSEPVYHSLEFALLDEEMSFQQRLRIFKWNTKGKSNIRFYSDNIAHQQRFGLKSIGDFQEDDLYVVCNKSRDPIKETAAQRIYETESYVLYRIGI